MTGLTKLLQENVKELEKLSNVRASWAVVGIQGLILRAARTTGVWLVMFHREAGTVPGLSV